MLAGLLVLTASTACAAGLRGAVRGGCAQRCAEPAVVLPLRPVEEGRLRDARQMARARSTASGRQSRAAERAAVVLFHRGHEHGGRIAHLVDELDLPEFDFFAWDARGHGRSPGERGYQPEPRHARCATCRASSSTSRQRTASRPEDIAVIAQSVGAVLVCDLGARLCARASACMVLASPAFKVKLYVPFARAGSRCCTSCAAVSSSIATSRRSS